MSIFNKVLVPVDFSADSPRAVAKALALAELASVTVLHVVADKSLAMPGDLIGLEDREALLASGQQAMSQFQSDNSLSQLATEIKAGNPADVICETATDGEYDLIIMPRHGHSRIERFLLGSVTSRVMEAAPCAMLILQHAS